MFSAVNIFSGLKQIVVSKSYVWNMLVGDIISSFQDWCVTIFLFWPFSIGYYETMKAEYKEVKGKKRI